MSKKCILKNLLLRYRQVNWALIDQAMVSGVNFLTGILFARWLGIEEYGRFVLAWMIVLFCNSIQLSGIISPMMSIGPRQKTQEEPSYYGAVIAQQLIWSFACFFLLWGGICLSGYFKPELNIKSIALPIASTILAWQSQDFIRRYFFIRGQGRFAFLNDVISYLGQLILLSLLSCQVQLNIRLVFWVIASSSAVAAIIGAFKIGPLKFFVKSVTEHGGTTLV